MEWVAAKSYYIGYNAVNRFLSIVFIHNYLFSGSLAFVCLLIPPCFYLFFPSSLTIHRSSQLLLVCLICLCNIGVLLVQFYFITGPGEPCLSFHACRSIVLISALAKPMGLYLTGLFALERLFSRILSRFLRASVPYRRLARRLFTWSIFLTAMLIFAVRLFEVMRYLPQRNFSNNITTTDDDDATDDITDTSSNSTDRNITFKYCFRSLDIDNYGKILSFYVIQYWYEYVASTVIFLILCLLFVYQCYSSCWSINTKLYTILASCILGSEFIILYFHLIVDDVDSNNTDAQLTSLQFMLFAHHMRCIVLPLCICLILSDPTKQFLHELFFLRPYLDNIDDHDQSSSTSPPQRDRFRRVFSRMKSKKNQEPFSNDDSWTGDL